MSMIVKPHQGKAGSNSQFSIKKTVVLVNRYMYQDIVQSSIIFKKSWNLWLIKSQDNNALIFVACQVISDIMKV